MQTAHGYAVFCNLTTHKHMIVPATEAERLEAAMAMTGYALVDDIFDTEWKAATVAGWFGCYVPVQVEVHRA